jgi:hypothetical protein
MFWNATPFLARFWAETSAVPVEGFVAPPGHKFFPSLGGEAGVLALRRSVLRELGAIGLTPLRFGLRPRWWHCGLWRACRRRRWLTAKAAQDRIAVKGGRNVQRRVRFCFRGCLWHGGRNRLYAIVYVERIVQFGVGISAGFILAICEVADVVTGRITASSVPSILNLRNLEV